jgi:hypothetical protein
MAIEKNATWGRGLSRPLGIVLIGAGSTLTLAAVMLLAGSELWRLRVGDLRVIYAIDDAARLVIVLRVARRSESAYRAR